MISSHSIPNTMLFTICVQKVARATEPEFERIRGLLQKPCGSTCVEISPWIEIQKRSKTRYKIKCSSCIRRFAEYKHIPRPELWPSKSADPASNTGSEAEPNQVASKRHRNEASKIRRPPLLGVPSMDCGNTSHASKERDDGGSGCRPSPRLRRS